jgi:6-phosphogluconolactonase
MGGRSLISASRIAAVLAAGFVMSSAQAATFLYVGSSDSQDITVLSLDPKSGALTEVAKTAVPGPAKPGGSLPLAVSPDKKFIFAGLRSEPFSVATFSIDPKSGKLTHTGSGPLEGSMAYISTDKTGKYLFAASYPQHRVTVSPIGAKGVVGATQQTVATEPNAHAIIADSTNKYVFHTSLGGDAVYQQKFDAKTGKLLPNDPATVKTNAKAGPRHIVFSPNSKFAYLLNELDATVYVFPYDAAKGTLKKEVQTVSAMPKGSSVKPWAADIHLTPDGKYLYASERTTSTIAAYKVDPAKGTLTPIDSYPTEKQPRAFAIDPGGRFLYSVGELSHSLTIHGIDPKTGALSKVKDMPIGKKPNWIEIVTLR